MEYTTYDYRFSFAFGIRIDSIFKIADKYNIIDKPNHEALIRKSPCVVVVNFFPDRFLLFYAAHGG